MSGTAHTAPASFAQERVWVAGQIAQQVPLLYHVADEFTVHAGVTPDQVQAAFGTIVQRHEPLRTALRARAGTLEQHVLLEIPLESALLFADLRGRSPAEQADLRAAIAEAVMYEPFDLERAPLWRAAVLRLDDADWSVLFAAHHAVCDAASVFNVYAELTELCAAAEANRAAVLPELPVSYRVHSARQRRRLRGNGKSELTDHWLKHLAGIEPVHGLPLDRPRGSRRDFGGDQVTGELPGELHGALAEMAAQRRTDPFAVLLAAFAVLLRRHSGRQEIVVGVPAGGRDRPELLPMIGAFTNMLVLRLELGGDPSFAELVGRVAEEAREARRHQEMPFQTLVELLAPAREPGTAALYQLGFNLVPYDGSGPPHGGGEPRSGAVEDELLLEVCGPRVRLEYRTALFDRTTVQCVLDDYLEVLARAVRTPELRISSLIPARRPRRTRPTARPPQLAARTAHEALVLEAWREHLREPDAGVLDDFFALGGHSLQALRMLAGLTERTGLRLEVADFFADPTAVALAARLDRLLTRRTP